jgi:hypothetical protein
MGIGRIDDGFIHSIYALIPTAPVEFSHNVEGIDVRNNRDGGPVPTAAAREGASPSRNMAWSAFPRQRNESSFTPAQAANFFTEEEDIVIMLYTRPRIAETAPQYLPLVMALPIRRPL